MIQNRRTAWLWVLSLLVLLAAQPVLAQQEGEADDGVDEEFLQTEARPEIEEFLEGEMEVLAGEGETYEPGDRRDPFISLITDRQQIAPRGPRPEGIPGLAIDDVEVTGIFLTAKGPVAQVRVADKRKSYLLHEGDQLYDGDVTSISFDEVVFKQILDDPAALKPFRPVVKELRPQGGD
jgi:hypothetical protein